MRLSGKKWLWIFISIIIFIIAANWFLGPKESEETITYRFATPELGTVTESVSTTGTIAAVGEVDLRPQVAGIIVEVFSDYNSQVKKGDLLAKIDPETFDQQVLQARADLAIAKASLVSSNAAVSRSEAELRNAKASLKSLEAQLDESTIGLNADQRELDRQKELFSRNVVTAVAVDNTQVKFDQSNAQFERISAQLMAQEATLDSREAALIQSKAGVTTSKAQVQQKEAKLNSSLIELSYTEIKSPVDGTIIDKNIELGQTVSTATNNNQPIFVIAQNLRQMQVEVDIDEADIGNIKEGMRVTFNVDAYTGRDYEGIVNQVRYAPQSIQNVVVYTIIVSTRNRDLSLLPGMTATVRVILAERNDVIRIPNSALRYQPINFVPETQPGREGTSTQSTGNQTRGGAGGGFADRLFAPYAHLNLTEQQRTEVGQKIMGNMRQVMSQMQAQGASREEMGEEVQRLVRSALVEVLTPEQREILENTVAPTSETQGQQGRQGRVFIVNDDGEPEPINITVGISDGGFTEMISGELGTDQNVIIGSNETVEPESSVRRRGIFGF